MSIVVSDTSPIRAFHHLKQLDLLFKLYQNVWIPTSVVDELQVVYPDFRKRMGADYSFLLERTPANPGLVQQLELQLDPGEANAIALAIEVKADSLLMDEALGRTIATQRGLKVIGVLGILSRAKREGLVEYVRPMLDELEYGLRFFLGNELKESTLRSLGE